MASGGAPSCPGRLSVRLNLTGQMAARILVDADPQADATARPADPESVRLSVADLVLGSAPAEQLAAGEAPRFGPEDVLVPTSVPRLRLAPSCIWLAAAEGDTPLGRNVLNSHLGAYERPCDFADIDMPSSLCPVAAACVYASTHLLVPVAPHTHGVLGLRLPVERLGNKPCGRGRVELLGVLCNLFDCRSRPSGECEEEGSEVFEHLRRLEEEQAAVK